ncbi:MAG: hypothetical protein M1833_005115 [Piccolia ochrophora]|nr:MAG: hypothetical protein M1833_005115 [Piccolia ochrophora]
MPVDDAPDDDATRQSYNVAPGYYEAVYRADVPDAGAGHRQEGRNHEATQGTTTVELLDNPEDASRPSSAPEETKYKLQAMKWGLVPFWTKRNPDYGSMLRTINCRDDSLLEDRGMWTSMKRKKRCIVLCQGFYEWLKKNGGKEKIPHFVKRKDGQLMCFAGLWDCAQFEGSDEKLYTYTIITTDSNQQLKFLHDRMPVILENGSEKLRTWLDPSRASWTKELQSLLKPFGGELEVYPVSKDVGKVGNNSPTFIVPISSPENKSNIANFFANAKAKGSPKKDASSQMHGGHMDPDIKLAEPGEERRTTKEDGSENNAPLPTPQTRDEEGDDASGRKRKHDECERDEGNNEPSAKSRKAPDTIPSKPVSPTTSPVKPPTSSRKTRSATSNLAGKSPKKGDAVKAADGSQKITNFFAR